MSHGAPKDLKQLISELNGLMQTVSLNLDLVSRRTDRDSLAFRYIDRMEDALERAESLIKQINSAINGDSFSVHPCGYILVIEDEPLLRSAVVESLEGMGFKALEVGEPLSCIKLFQDNSSEISLLLIDLRLPYMDGVELYQKLQNIRKVPVLFMSGSGDGSEIVSRLGFNVPFLPKPFMNQELEQKVREVLGLPRNVTLK